MSRTIIAKGQPMIRAFAFAICILVALTAPVCAEASKPNIVYILADDLGYGDVQSLNPQRGKIKTPHLDRLASQGMIFTDAHSGSSVCTPTRYGLLTGRYAWRSRLQNGVLDGGSDEPLIAADRLTVPGLLGQHGYVTACIGKWHLGFIVEPPASAENAKAKRPKGGGAPVGSAIVGGPVTRGFDSFFGCSNARTMSALIENDKVIEQIEPVTMLPRLADRAVNYIAQRAATENAGKPFFLYLPLTSPHTPIVPSAEWKGTSGLGDYGDFVMQTDAVVGQVLAALDMHDLAKNTIVIFSADNGCSPQAGMAKLEAAGHFPSAQFRGHKADIWEGGHRVPFLVRWPGRVKAGATSDQLICHTDLMATCAEILGVAIPENAGPDSVSILPALLGKATQPLREAIVHHSIEGEFSIRQGKWKLALCPGSGGWGKPGDADAMKLGLPVVQLYDMSTDIAETKNLQAQHPDVVAQLTQLLKKYVDQGRSSPGKKQANDVRVEIVKAHIQKKDKQGTDQ